MGINIASVDAELTAMAKRVDRGTIVALKKVQQVTKTSIKSGMRGRPRTNHRGKSKRTGANITNPDAPRTTVRGGGPGKLSGALFKSIRSSKRPHPVYGGYSGVVMSGGAGGPQNLYKRKVEANQPYFKPGVEKATPKMPAVWHAAWAKATRTKK